MRVLSGIQSTGRKHLGNHLGALRSWVALQERSDAFYCVVDLHTLTVAGDPAQRRADSLSVATLLLACGLDPGRCALFLQSHVPAHTQLSWLLECTASYGEMRRMTQFKDKSARGGESESRLGLFTYPVLMAADILLYDTDAVPVGDDQRQHLELTRVLAERFNARYGPTFRVPEALIGSKAEGGRIMDLQHPTVKMSTTSDSPAGTIYMLDEPSAIVRKINRAVTDPDDSDDPVRYDVEAKPGVSNLLDILAAATGRDPAAVAGEYRRYGPLKRDAGEAVVALLEPIQARYAELAADPGAVADVLRQGAGRAATVADATVARASAAIGLVAP